jgi:DmsE family decaheme c-type cytochrome
MKPAMLWLLGLLSCLGILAQAAELPDLAPAVTANAATVAAARSSRDAACTRCHDESETKPVLAIYQTRHGVKGDPRTPSCQSCHGESQQHLKGDTDGKGRAAPDVVYHKGTYAATDATTQAGSCLTCHQDGKRTHWSGSQHQSRDIPCSSCHAVHRAADPVLSKVTQAEVCFTCHKTQRAQTHLISTHPLAAGKMACTDCHNPHGSTGPNLLVQNSVNQTCYTCHAEKRGPFLWEHGPVVDDCSNCHTPHGSAKTPLLKARVPFLCQECHSGDHAAQQNSGANLADGANVTAAGTQKFGSISPRNQLGARACLNCHVLIHGSNHPAGAKFQR